MAQQILAKYVPSVHSRKRNRAERTYTLIDINGVRRAFHETALVGMMMSGIIIVQGLYIDKNGALHENRKELIEMYGRQVLN